MRTNSRKILWISCCAVAGGAFLFSEKSPFLSAPHALSPCTANAIDLPDGAPPELFAVLSQSCATFLADSDEDTRLTLAQDYGYPSLLWDDFPTEDVLDSWAAIAAEGDHEYFRHDQKIQEIVMKSDASEPLKAFVFASTSEVAPPPPEIDLKLWALALPIWENGVVASKLVDACIGDQCRGKPTLCAGDVGLDDKLLVAKGSKLLADLVDDCPMTDGWLRALRRAGLLDTTCTSTLQINRVLNDGLGPTEVCFSDPLADRQEMVTTSADVVRQLRRVLTADPQAVPSQDFLAELALYFPTIATFYINRVK
jgi:hypothetical protein